MLSPFRSLCVGNSELQQHRAWIVRRIQRTFWGEIYGIDNSQACIIGSATTSEEYLANQMLYIATCVSSRHSYNIFKAIMIQRQFIGCWQCCPCLAAKICWKNCQPLG